MNLCIGGPMRLRALIRIIASTVAAAHQPRAHPGRIKKLHIRHTHLEGPTPQQLQTRVQNGWGCENIGLATSHFLCFFYPHQLLTFKLIGGPVLSDS